MAAAVPTVITKMVIKDRPAVRVLDRCSRGTSSGCSCVCHGEVMEQGAAEALREAFQRLAK